MQKNRGFTLIELLVVIAIIAVLSGAVILATTTTRTKSRDTGRFETIHEVQNALQLYHSQNGSFPLAAAPTDLSTALTSSLVPTYIQGINFDTSNVSGAVYYRPASNPDSYLIYVTLEQQTQASPASYGCRTGVGPVVDSGLYSTAPKCQR